MPEPRPSGRMASLYELVVTPINFVSFLLSLILVDLQNSNKRMHDHSGKPCRLPAWLHYMIFQSQPRVTGMHGTPQDSHCYDDQWCYHAHQAKLVKLEVEEAFKIRNRVTVVLGLFLAIVTWTLWHLVKVVYQRWYH